MTNAAQTIRQREKEGEAGNGVKLSAIARRAGA